MSDSNNLFYRTPKFGWASQRIQNITGLPLTLLIPLRILCISPLSHFSAEKILMYTFFFLIQGVHRTLEHMDIKL